MNDRTIFPLGPREDPTSFLPCWSQAIRLSLVCDCTTPMAIHGLLALSAICLPSSKDYSQTRQGPLFQSSFMNSCLQQAKATNWGCVCSMSLPLDTLLPTFIKVTVRVGSTRADISIHITLSPHTLQGIPFLSATTDLNPCLPGLELSIQMAILWRVRGFMSPLRLRGNPSALQFETAQPKL